MFIDREDAAYSLAKTVQKKLSFSNVIVLGLPRGGVPIASIIANELEVDFDIICVKKIGFPGDPELAIGAITESGSTYINGPIRSMSALRDIEFDILLNSSKETALKNAKYFRYGQDMVSIKNKNVIIVDDGIATGATILASINQVKESGASSIHIAVPVAPKDILEKIKQKVDSVIVLETPSPFVSVGKWYETFNQVLDTEVREIYDRHCLKNSIIEKTIVHLGITIRMNLLQNSKAYLLYYEDSINSNVSNFLTDQGISQFYLKMPKKDKLNIELTYTKLVLAINWLTKSEFFTPSIPLVIYCHGKSVAAVFKVAATLKESKFNGIIINSPHFGELERQDYRNVIVPVLIICSSREYLANESIKKAHEQLPYSKVELIQTSTVRLDQYFSEIEILISDFIKNVAGKKPMLRVVNHDFLESNYLQ